MNTVSEWVKAHSGVRIAAFERNWNKSFGFGTWEDVCGFCLASHYFNERPPKHCRFCQAPLRETHVISDLPEVTKRIYKFT